MKQKRKVMPLLVFIICYMAYSCSYVSRQALSVSGTPLQNMGIMTASQIGVLGSVFFCVYSCSRLINGPLGDKIPSNLMAATGLFLVAGSNFGISFLPPFWAFAVLWGVNAFGQSMLWGPMLRILGVTFDSKRLSKVMAVFATCLYAGLIFGNFLASFMITNFGLNAAFITPAVLAATVGTAIFLIARNKNGDNSAVSSSVEVEEHRTVRDLMRDKNILASVPGCLFHGVIKDNINLWMSMYFVSHFSVDLGKSTLLIVFIPLFSFLGRLFYPTLYRICRYNIERVNAVAFVMCAAGALPVTLIPKSEGGGMLIPVVAAISLGVVAAAISIVNHSFLTMVPLAYAKYGASSTVSGLMDFIVYMGAGLGSLAYGFLLDHFDYPAMYLTWVIIGVIGVMYAYWRSRKKNVLI